MLFASNVRPAVPDTRDGQSPQRTPDVISLRSVHFSCHFCTNLCCSDDGTHKLLLSTVYVRTQL